MSRRPLCNYQDRQYGRNFPFYINESQLAIIRAQARIVCTRNSYALGLLTPVAIP
jgi:hypothetical protein